jgi:hypothetical protein
VVGECCGEDDELVVRGLKGPSIMSQSSSLGARGSAFRSADPPVLFIADCWVLGMFGVVGGDVLNDSWTVHLYIREIVINDHH